ncbi:MAG: glycerophosphodiester phosphodiesterase [Myxococcota bacterium]
MFDDLDKPLLFAHRGASLRAPENTLEAFELGARCGADVLELDVRTSYDGQVVVLHDADLARTTNGQGPVTSHNYADLNKLDAGYRFQDTSGASLFRDKGVYVPLLEEVLRAFPRMGFNIEIKQANPPMVRPVLEIIERVGTKNILLAGSDDRVMDELEHQAPHMPLGLSIGRCKEILRGAYLGHIPDKYQGRALQIPPRRYGVPVATKRLLRKAKEAGLVVHIWTINSPTAARKWLQRGVDGVMSDDPGPMAAVFADFRAKAAARTFQS